MLVFGRGGWSVRGTEVAVRYTEWYNWNKCADVQRHNIVYKMANNFIRLKCTNCFSQPPPLLCLPTTCLLATPSAAHPIKTLVSTPTYIWSLLSCVTPSLGKSQKIKFNGGKTFKMSLLIPLTPILLQFYRTTRKHFQLKKRDHNSLFLSAWPYLNWTEDFCRLKVHGFRGRIILLFSALGHMYKFVLTVIAN